MKNKYLLALITTIVISSNLSAELRPLIGQEVSGSDNIFKLISEMHQDLWNPACLKYNLRMQTDYDLLAFAGYYIDSINISKGLPFEYNDQSFETIDAKITFKSNKNINDSKIEIINCAITQ